MNFDEIITNSVFAYPDKLVWSNEVALKFIRDGLNLIDKVRNQVKHIPNSPDLLDIVQCCSVLLIKAKLMKNAFSIN